MDVVQEHPLDCAHARPCPHHQRDLRHLPCHVQLPHRRLRRERLLCRRRSRIHEECLRLVVPAIRDLHTVSAASLRLRHNVSIASVAPYNCPPTSAQPRSPLPTPSSSSPRFSASSPLSASPSQPPSPPSIDYLSSPPGAQASQVEVEVLQPPPPAWAQLLP